MRLAGAFLISTALCAPAHAQFNGCAPGVCNITAPGALFPLPGITPNGLDCYYSRGIYYPSQAACSLTVTRTTSNGSATVSDANGNWSTVSNNTIRLGSGNGVLMEETRTNSIRNSSAQGASTGTPGVLPTNWNNLTPNNGIAKNVVGLGTENGINYVDIQMVGTSNAAFASLISFESATQVAASYGQTWTSSFFAKLAGGSLAGISDVQIFTQELNSSGVQLGFSQTAITLSTSALGGNRVNNTRTILASTAAFVNNGYFIDFPMGANINIIIRVGWPQLENNALINSTLVTGAQTISNNGTAACTSGTYTVVGGTGTPATLTGVASGGVITSLMQLTPGSYTVFPPSPAALSGTNCSGSPTVTLTPADNSGQGFATSPVVTNMSAGTRGAEVDTITTPPVFGSAYSEFSSGVPIAPVSYGTEQVIVSIDNGANTNRLQLQRLSSGGAANVAMVSSNSTLYNQNGSSWAQSEFAKFAGSSVAGTQNAAFNGNSLTAGSGTPNPVGPNTVHIGTRADGLAAFNGYVARAAIWPTTAISSTVLRSVTTLP